MKDTVSFRDQLSANWNKESLIFSPTAIVVISWLSLIEVSVIIPWLRPGHFQAHSVFFEVWME